MSVARDVIPSGIRVLLGGVLQRDVDQAYRLAEQKALAQVHSRRRRAEHAASAVHWLQSEANTHVIVCPCSNHGQTECPELRQLKADMALARRRYTRALKRLVGGR